MYITKLTMLKLFRNFSLLVRLRSFYSDVVGQKRSSHQNFEVKKIQRFAVTKNNNRNKLNAKHPHESNLTISLTAKSKHFLPIFIRLQVANYAQ